MTIHERRAFRKRCELNITLKDGCTNRIFFRRNQKILIQDGLDLKQARVVRVNSRGMLRAVVPIRLPDTRVFIDECVDLDDDDMIEMAKYLSRTMPNG